MAHDIPPFTMTGKRPWHRLDTVVVHTSALHRFEKNDNASPWPGRAPRPKRRVTYAARILFAALMESYGRLPYV